jgi:hypothetical protein
MISSEVQRTLVKSPPELWAELSDPSALARHLGELGDIRITHLEPETAVEWEAEDASGTVLLKASGWGTKVTLTVNRELPDPAPEAPEAESPIPEEPPPPPMPMADPEPESVPHAHSEPVLPIAEPEPEPTAEEEHEDQPEDVPLAAAVDREPADEAESRRGFFARLFRRGAREQAPDPAPHELPASIRPPEAHPDLAASVEYLSEPPWAIATPQLLPEPLHSLEQDVQAHEHASPVEAIESDEPVAHEEPVVHDEPAEPADSDDEQPADISAELRAAEEATAEQVTAMLTGVLDRLGAAHHRPFSRS